MRIAALRPLVVAAAAAGALTLTGCGNAVESIAQAGIEKAMEDQTGAEVDVDADGGVTIENEDGSVKMGAAAELPADFPSEFPLPDGTLTTVYQASGGWSLSYEGVDEAEVDSLVDHYTSEGYEKLMAVTSADGALYSFLKAPWMVSLTWDGSSDSKAMVYAITPTSS